MKNKINKIIHIFILILFSILIVASFFIKKEFSSVSIEELYFYATNGVTNSDNNVFIIAIKTCLPFVILLSVIFYAIFYDITFGHKKIKYALNIQKYKKIIPNKSSKKKNRRSKKNIKTVQLYPIKIVHNHKIKSTLILFIITIIIAANNINGINFIKNSNTNSKFIEINYVNPKKTKINFKEKNNLIIITVESLETTFFTKKQGGSWNYEVTPELYKLLNDKDVTTFYNKKLAEEMTMVEGASWTTASLISNTSGLPFKIPIDGNSYHSKNFMNGAYTLGDLLKENGYHNELISSAVTSFGGINDYFTKHGNYDIIDADTLSKYNLNMSKKDNNPWGFNDNYLFETAKERLQIISKENEPFNLNLVTIDTHFPDGFVYDYSKSKYKTQYENAYATTSQLIYDFVKWIKKQDFYENTTILIVGDHLSMEKEYFKKHNAKNRHIYYCIINSKVKAKNTKDRIYTALDTYPTIVSAIGGNIKGERLGLGVNMFSNKKTLSEKYTFEKLNKEVQKKSDFYNEKILGDDYQKMKENKE